MKVLITGGAGYIGSHTCKYLAACGHEIVVYDNLSSGYKEFAKYGKFIYGDIRDTQALRACINTFKPDGVIHFAAFIAVGESVTDPGKYYNNNVIGTLSLLQAMRDEDVHNIVVSSTAAVYGQASDEKLKENSILAPINPYGHSKLFMEKMLESFNVAHGFNYIALRYFNACGCDPELEIGERHKPETHLIPRALMATIGLIPSLSLFGNDYPTPDGTCIRDYIHVCDLARAHAMALEKIVALPKKSYAKAINLGTGTGISVQEIIDTIRKVTEKDVPYTMAQRREGDPAQLIADASLAKKELNFSPLYSTPEQIIRTAYAWICKDIENQKEE